MNSIALPKPEKRIKTRKPRRVRTERQKKLDLADKLFSLLIRKVGYCQLAGKDKIRCGGGLQCMHVITRGNKGIRWDPANAICGCAGHHVYYTHNPEAWRDFMSTNFPEEWEYVNSVRNEIWDKDIDKILEGLEGV